MFSKSKFCSEIEVKYGVPKAHGGGIVIIALTLATNSEYEIIRQAFLALPTAERTGEKVLEFIRKFVCALLAREPEGIEDFPVFVEIHSQEGENQNAITRNTDLFTRAFSYFTKNEPELQEFLDDIILTAWLAWKEATEPDTFSGTVSDNGERESGSGAGAA